VLVVGWLVGVLVVRWLVVGILVGNFQEFHPSPVQGLFGQPFQTQSWLFGRLVGFLVGRPPPPPLFHPSYAEDAWIARQQARAGEADLITAIDK
jgi:hypothetical protein